jgi:hypothetical protein
MITAYMELENEAREAQVVNSTILVKERHNAVAKYKKERSEKIRAEKARDDAIKDKEHADAMLQEVMARLVALEQQVGQTKL